MLQERLSGLAILAIESEEASKLDTKEMIKVFADAKARRKRFD